LELDLNAIPISNNAGSTGSGNSRDVDVDKWIDEIEVMESVDSPSGAKANENEEDTIIGYYSPLVTPKKLTFDSEQYNCKASTSTQNYVHTETLDGMKKSIHFWQWRNPH
jgi:hypothetical protein